MNTRRSSQISFVFALGLLLMLGLTVTESDAECPGSRCKTNICEAQGLNCCQCRPFSSNNPLEVCACCPSGYYCNPTNAPWDLPTCCPGKSEYDGNNYKGCVTSVPSVPSDYSCATCGRMYLSITADDVINDLYIDGVSVSSSLSSPNGWGNVRTIEIPADAKVIATDCSDTARVVAGVLASTTNDYLITSSAWKCTTKEYDGWMEQSFDDTTWPNAVISGSNSVLDIHGFLPPISPAASWIWTENYAHHNIDERVFCRGRFPTSIGCDLKYGNCSNLCLREKKRCCGCELNGLGPSIACNCCPWDHQCCPNPNGLATCCPARSICLPEGRCMVYSKPVPAELSCSNCTSTRR